MTDERDINALRHYVARLEDDLAIAEDAVEHLRRHSSKAEDAVEHLHRHSSKQAADIITLSQEVGRLREALLTGACMLSEMGVSSVEKCQLAYDHLSAALAEKEEKQ